MIPLTRLAVLIAVTAILTSTTTPHRIIGSAARADPIEINVRPVHLHPDRPSVDRVGRLRFQGGLRLSSRDRPFGGLSGMRFIGRDQILAVSDRGWWISFRIVEEQGRLVGVSQATLDPMLSARGTRITPRSERDAEALEIAPDGTVLVSFEGRHRLWRYSAPPAHFQAPASELGGLAAWPALPINGGFEAMASLTGNRRLVIAEHARADEGSLAGWLLEHGRHKQLTYETVGQFVPTDLARLASGDLVALERRFTPVGGFASRLQIIDQHSITAGARSRDRASATPTADRKL